MRRLSTIVSLVSWEMFLRDFSQNTSSDDRVQVPPDGAAAGFKNRTSANIFAFLSALFLRWDSASTFVGRGWGHFEWQILFSRENKLQAALWQPTKYQQIRKFNRRRKVGGKGGWKVSWITPWNINFQKQLNAYVVSSVTKSRSRKKLFVGGFGEKDNFLKQFFLGEISTE